MNHIPRFFLYNRRKNQMNNRKLDRRLALKKNIDYEPPPPPPSSSNSDTCHSLRTQSLDLPPSSFRIQGIDDGEFDLICQTLGLSGPDDFGIPVAAWEARKTRSVSDLLPRLREEEERENFGEKGVIHLSDRFQDSIRVSNEVINDNINIDRSVNLGHTESCSEISPSIVDNSRSIWRISRDNNKNAANITNIDEINSNQQPFVPPAIIDDTSSILDMNSDDINGNRSVFMDPSNHCSTSGACNKGDVPLIFPQINNGDNNGDAILNKYPNIGSIGGIKEVRPPILAPPPSVSTRIIDNTSSTWDIMRSFAPESDKTPSSERERGSYSDEEEDREVRPRGSTAFLSESCSFTTTSNDDDSSSTTTEPMSNISPNGRFKRVITYWEKGELLGRGSFGSVYEGIADGGYFIAVKEVSLLDQGDMGRQSIYQLEQEIALLSQFEHENIVQYYGTDKDDAHLYIFLELVTKGSLLSLYQKYHLRDSQVSSYTRQILHGLKYLHERNVVHRDIKCANILVGADGSVKLADFGLAKATKLNDVKSCKGTAFWMAPEVVRGRHQGYGLPADIWSLGCTVLEMLTHRIPYSPLECMQALFRIGRGEPPPIPDSLSRDARDFISRCLKVDPNDRPTATQLLDHQFVKRPLSTSSGSLSPYHSSGPGLNPFSR